MRKHMCWIPVCLLLLALTSCQKQVVTPDVQTAEPVTAEIARETAQEELTLDPEHPVEPGMHEKEVTPEKPVLPTSTLTPDEKKMLHERLYYATVCTCLMKDSACWHLLDLGIEADALADDFHSAMNAFEQALYAYPADMFTKDTFWLIDTTYHGLELQFWKYDAHGHPGQFSCTAAFYWESGMENAELLGEDLLLCTLDWAQCTKDASDEERTRILEQYERLLPDFSTGTGWRVSMAPDGKLALMALDPERGGEVFYACGQISGPIIWSSDDLPIGTNDPLYRTLVGAAFDESVIAEDRQIFLRGFLACGLYAYDFVLWDGPYPVDSFNDVYLAYDCRRACLAFLDELRTDEAAGNVFLKSGPWTLFYDGGAEFRLANGTGEEILLSGPLPQ